MRPIPPSPPDKQHESRGDPLRHGRTHLNVPAPKDEQLLVVGTAHRGSEAPTVGGEPPEQGPELVYPRRRCRDQDGAVRSALGASPRLRWR